MSADARRSATSVKAGPAPQAAAPGRSVPSASRPQPGPRTTQGDVQSSTVPTLFHELGQRRATGVLTVSWENIKKLVHFQDGSVQFATSNDRDDRFNQVLLKAGVISLRNVLRALEVSLVTRDRLGEVMVRSKMLPASEIEKWVRVQVREIVYSLFERTSGPWSFEEKPFPAESISLDLPADVLVIEGMRRISSWARVYEEVGGLNTEYLATREVGAIVGELPLQPGELKLLEMCRTPTSLGEMCDASELGDLQVCRSIWALLVVGALMKS